MSLSFESVADLAAALDVLAGEGERVFPLAGGTDLMPGVRAGHVSSGILLDISRLDGLKGIHCSPASTFIGSLTTAAELARSDALGRRLPPLVSAASVLGSPQVRNRATVGGNVVNASPAADMLVALVGLGAHVKLASRRGERLLALDEFFVGPGLTRRGPDELVLGFDVAVRAGRRAAFHKVGLRRALACAVCSVSVAVVPAEGGGCVEALIVLGAVGPTPVRARVAEGLLVSGGSGPRDITAVAQAAADACSPIDDVRASAAYRRHLVRVWTERLLTQLLSPVMEVA